MNRRDFLIGSGGAVIGGVSSLTGYRLLTNSDENNTGDQSSNNISVENAPKIGYNNEPVDLIYWVDFQCPYCYRFSENQYPQIKQNYISSGDVRFILKPLKIFGEDSVRAAESMHCVYNINKDLVEDWYNKLHDLFDESSGRNTGWATYENLSSEVTSIGIQESELKKCLDNNSYDNKMQSDQREGENVGLRGTPYFMVYNQENRGDYETISGAQQYNLFESKINNKI